MNLLKSFSLYTFATFFQRGIGFVLAPILSYELSEEEYGILALINIYALITGTLIGLGSKAAISVQYFKVKQAEFQSYFSSTIFSPGLVFSFMLVLIMLFQNQLASITGIPTAWVLVVPLLAFFNLANDLCLSLFRIQERPSSFVRYSMSWSVLNLLLSLWFILGMDLRWEGRVWGIFFSAAFFSLIALLIFHRQSLIKGPVQKKYIKHALTFGLPLIPYLLGAFVVEQSDKIFIQQMLGKAELGIYNMGYQFGQSIQMLVTAFLLAFTPILYAALKDMDRAVLLSVVRYAYLFILVSALAVVALFFISPLLFDILIDEKFYRSHIFVGWVGLGYFFYGCYSLFANFIHFSGKTYYFTYLSVVNVILNLGLNYALILEYGAIGAAYATILSFLVSFILVALLATRLYKLPWFDPRVWKWKNN